MIFDPWAKVRLGLICALLALASCPPLFSAAPDAAGIEFFEKNIRPVLAERCYKCHSAGSKELKGGLLLDSQPAMLKGGDGGSVLAVGQPEKSRLITAIRYVDDELQMPPDKQLSTEQIAAFEEWIKMGAPDPRRAETAAPVGAGIDFERARQFWSFRPLSHPAVPVVANQSWPLTDIDRYLLDAMQARHLAPVESADKRTLIRRATFDLTGLPPTPDEVDNFINDTSSRAFETLVDRLLASPHYGERWGRHWLDLVRYADTSGCNSDYPVPSAYRYRNYVIDSFNQDKPYDQFVREQIAGDLLPADSEAARREHIVATGYLALARRFGSRAAEFHLTIEDTIDNVGKVFLGLSVSCARCHDHKFDPIPNEDYYALYGIFSSTKYAFPGTEIYKHPKDFIPLASPDQAAALAKYEAEMAEIDDRIERLTEQRKPLQNAESEEPEDGPARIALLKIKAELDDLKTKQRRLEDRPPLVDKAYAVSEGKPGNVHLQKKGDPKIEGDEIPRGFLQVLGGQKLPQDEAGSGRGELAQWITDPNNPLTARVTVNRIWQHHFGRGLVQTPNDFGARGKAPTHPELLDYLAARFIDSGWAVKAMHRAIMLSRAYQMSSEDHPACSGIDPGNDYLWRFNRRRLSAEEIRDALLQVGGSLDTTVGGAHPFPPENEWKYTQHKPFVANYETNKRSVYLMQQRIKKQPYLEVFDGADTNATTPDRPLSTTAIQALFWMNDALVHEQADKLAVRVGLAFTKEKKRIGYAYQLAFGRPPTNEEVDTGRQFLAECREKLNRAGLPDDQQVRAALGSYMRVLLSSSEFVFVD